MIYQGKRISVENKDGFDIVRHPGAVVILPLLDPQTVIMIRNNRRAINKTLWELPAGTLEHDELPLMCAKRELEEETGFKAKTLKPLLDFYSTPGFSDEKLHAFLATDLKPTKQNLDADEEIEVKAMSFTAILEMIRKNEIEDAKTLTTLLFYSLF